MTHPLMGDIVLPRAPIRFSDYDTPELEFFPEPGAHNDEVFADLLGLSADAIDTLRQGKVI